MHFHNLVPLFALIAVAQAPHPPSIHITSSIISRHQGILSSPFDRSDVLQASVLQKAFRQLTLQESNHPSITAHALSSIGSVITDIINASIDTTYPLDRPSASNGLIHAYYETGIWTYRHRQLRLVWKHTYQDSSGVLVHGFDTSRRALWAGVHTGASGIVWGRSLG